MNPSRAQGTSQGSPSQRRAALEAACQRIAPAWPLDRQIAVSPYWGYREQPFAATAARLRRLAGAPLTHARAEYLRAWNAGEIQPAHLEQALREYSGVPGVQAAVEALERPTRDWPGLPLLSDVLDEASPSPDGLSWNTRLTEQVSQYCAAYFDRLQADWRPDHRHGFYSGWRSALQQERSAELRVRAALLPQDGDTALDWALERLAVRDAQLPELLEVIALRIGGWAAWCAWLRWEAALAGRTDQHLASLLIIRLCWEALLHDGRHDEHSAWSAWMRRWGAAEPLDDAAALATDLLWQRAHEVAYQHTLFAAVSSEPAGAARSCSEPPRAHLVFCIDVRSERIRRALESLDPDVRTYGYAGFFGLPIRYAPLGTPLEQARLPGLIAPTLSVRDSSGDPARDSQLSAARQARLARRASLEPFLRLPSGTFSTVEMFGLSYLPKLLAGAVGRSAMPSPPADLRARETSRLRPRLDTTGPEGPAAAAALVAGILRGVGITAPLGRLLVLIGHGSQSANNPQAAGLECGACGGHSGEVNARLLADLLNDRAVRTALAERGIDIPEHTRAIAGLHNTTTDVVELFDPQELPSTHAADLQWLRESLQQAGARVRRERAASVGLARFAERDAALLRRLRRKAQDWAEVRPEWGLAGNAAMIIAERERTCGIDLCGRVFLHEYRRADDPDGTLLEQICAGPLLVAHWINLQYYGSTVDPQRFGSGNKVLHNVIGERIGVLEGYGGDLRIGLARQSVHDGTRWMHAPLRLSVLIDAPRARIEQVIDRQPTLRDLLENQWLYLYRLESRSIERWCEGIWTPCDAPGRSQPAPPASMRTG